MKEKPIVKESVSIYSKSRYPRPEVVPHNISSKPKLDIPFSRVCKCPPKNLNCMTAKEWIKAQIGVWQFYYEAKDIRDKALHPATFPISLARRVIELFTHKGELVLDPFIGSGTTLLAARDTERNAVGFDLNPQYVALSEKRLSNLSLFEDTKQIAVCDDALNIPDYLESLSSF